MARVAQVGCGYWGRNLVRNYAQIGALAAVVDGHPVTAQALSAEHGVPISTWDAVLADPAIDGVSLATPAPMHAAMASQALAAGKHVFVEKPLALTPADAEPLVQQAEAADRVLMVGHLLQYHPVFEALLREVHSGRIGTPRYAYSNRLSLGKFRVEENVLWSFAPHDLSMLIAIAGASPSAVSASGASFVTAGIADWAVANLTFPTGLRAHVQVSWAHPFKEHRLVVVGETGALVFEDSAADWERKLALYPHVIDIDAPAPLPTKGALVYLDVPRGEPLRSECQHFCDSIDNRTTPRTDGLEGLRVLEALHMAEAALARSLGEEVAQ